MADYTRVYTGDDGLSHFEDLDFDYGDLSGAQTPAAQGVEAASASPGNVIGAVFRRFALGNSGKHLAPRKQYAIARRMDYDSGRRHTVPQQLTLSRSYHRT
jgi:hypothetical protein